MPMPLTAAHTGRLSVFNTTRRPRDLPEDFRKSFEDRADAVGVAMESFLTKFDATMTSPRLTRNGALQEVSALSVAQIAELTTNHASMRDKLTSQIDAAKAAALSRAAKPEDATLRYLRHKDIVDFYTAQDPLQHKQILDEAVREKDLDFLDALATAPRHRRKFDLTPISAAREQLASETDPAIAKLTELRASYDRMFQTAITVVRETAQSAGIVRLDVNG